MVVISLMHNEKKQKCIIDTNSSNHRYSLEVNILISVLEKIGHRKGNLPVVKF